MAKTDPTAVQILDDRAKLDSSEAESSQAPASEQIADAVLADPTVNRRMATPSSDYYWESDADHRITRLSYTDATHEQRASKILLGKRRSETGTVPLSGSWDDHNSILHAHRSFSNFLVKFAEPDGYVRYISVAGMPRFSETSDFLGYVGISRDVTADVQLQTITDLEIEVLRLLAGTSYHDAIRASLELVCRRLGWRSARYWELDEAGSDLVLAASTPLEERVEIRGINLRSRELTELRGDTLGRAWHNCSTVIETHASDGHGEASDAAVFKKIAIPFSDRSGPFAMMEFSADRLDFSEDHLSRFVAHLSAEVLIAHDRHCAINELRESEERLSTTFDLAAIGLCHIGKGGRIIHVNQHLAEMLGYSKAELLSKTVVDISHPGDRDATGDYANRLGKREIDQFEVEKRYVRKDGQSIWVRIKTVMKWSGQGDPLYHVSVVEDISERKQVEAKIEHLATHDELTGLANRVLFKDLLSHSIEAQKRDVKAKSAVLFIDLDRFKVINDSLGHAAGDTLLKTAAERFQNIIRSRDRIARFGGDEFVVLLNGITDATEAETVAARLLAVLTEPMYLEKQECRVTASIGVAVWPDDGDDDHTLLRNADAAMYAAKQSGKNDYRRYSVDMAPTSVNSVRLETHLRHALEREEFRIHYQQRVDAQSGRIVGVEALLRWWNRELGTIPPVQFIPIAEDSGLIIQIGKWLLQSACRQHAAWQKRGLQPIIMSVNLSPKQFADPDLLKNIRGTLSRTGMEAKYLELEITEGMLVSDLERAIETAMELRNLGVRLAIDDFGTGYSSMMQLKRFPLDTLKIDRSFVRDLSANPEDRAITKAIVALGRTLGATVVAEGVESEDQRRLLTKLRCHELQGFLFGKPCPPEEMARVLRLATELSFATVAPPADRTLVEEGPHDD